MIPNLQNPQKPSILSSKFFQKRLWSSFMIRIKTMLVVLTHNSCKWTELSEILGSPCRAEGKPDQIGWRVIAKHNISHPMEEPLRVATLPWWPALVGSFHVPVRPALFCNTPVLNVSLF